MTATQKTPVFNGKNFQESMIMFNRDRFISDFNEAVSNENCEELNIVVNTAEEFIEMKNLFRAHFGVDLEEFFAGERRR